MYLWTQKAEDDFRTRHPEANEKNIKRRAGQPATYDGKPVTVTIASAFKMRGWIVEEKQNKKSKAKKKEQALWSQWQKRINEKQIILEA